MKYRLFPFIPALFSEEQQLLGSLVCQSGSFRNLRHHILVFPKQHVIYIETPKAACTKIKKSLFEAAGIAVPDHLSSHAFHRYCRLHAPGYRLSDTELAHALTSPDYFRFAFVRNPYSRLYSAYCDKIMHTHRAPNSDFYGEYRRIIRFYNMNLGDPVSFDHFVRWAIQCPLSEINHHWMPQIHVLWWHKLHYDFVGKVEHFEQDFLPILARFHETESAVSCLQEHENARTDGQSWQQAYTPELRALVYDAYRQDFDSFGYSRE